MKGENQMNQSQSVLDCITVLYDQLFDAEKKIAKFILNNPKKVVDMTVSELAEISDVSIASVSRFCRKVGLKGFAQLKISLAQELVDTHKSGEVSNDISVDNIPQSLQNILANKITELKQTVNLINTDEFKEILEGIRDASRVQVIAVGNTIPVAIDAAFKFNELGIPTTAGTIWETQLSYSFTLGKGDVLIAISVVSRRIADRISKVSGDEKTGEGGNQNGQSKRIIHAHP